MVNPTLLKVLAVALTIAPVVVVVRQCRKPWSWPGRLFIWLMNRTHADLIQWGLGHVPVVGDATILDVGCGGGQTIRTLASMGGRVYGVDYSATSVDAAKKANTDLIASERVQILQAGVSQLPFDDAFFDLATAVETHYYWPNLVQDFQELRRVLKPGGTLLVLAETYRDQRHSAFLIVPMLLLRARYLTLDEHRSLLQAAGFTGIEIDHDSRKGWICCVARRPL